MSDFSDPQKAQTFAAVKWRIAEVEDNTEYTPTRHWRQYYTHSAEIELAVFQGDTGAVWQAGRLAVDGLR